jgi:hypothetical protein
MTHRNVTGPGTFTVFVQALLITMRFLQFTGRRHDASSAPRASEYEVLVGKVRQRSSASCQAIDAELAESPAICLR